MKKFLVCLLSAAMLLTSAGFSAFAAEADTWDGTASSKTWYGDGSDNTFTISTAAELAGLAELVNSGTNFEGKTISLGADIDLAGNEWTMIGKNGAAFSGTFDGQDHTIYNMSINNQQVDYCGFFYRLSGADVKNLHISSVDITSAGWAGALAGHAGNTTITNCTVAGTISASGAEGVAAAGLVEYSAQSSIVDCTADIIINADSPKTGITYAGGIACEVSGGAITGCTTLGIITAKSANDENYYTYAGGIAAYAKNGAAITGCTNSADISVGDTTTYYAVAGGILGQIWAESPGTITVTGCTNTGSVTAEASYWPCQANKIGETYAYDGNGQKVNTVILDEMQEGDIGWNQQDEAAVELVLPDGSTYGYATLQEAIADAEQGATVQLLQNITLDKMLTIPETADITLDLAGRTLTVDHVNKFEIDVYGKLKLIDSNTAAPGKVDCIGQKGIVRGAILVSNNGEFVMDSGYITGAYGVGVVVYNNAQVIINDGKIDTEYFAITGNGSDITQNTTITINGGELVPPDNTAIYHPQPGTLNIHGGLIQSATGIEMRTGTLNVDGGKIVGLHPSLLEQDSDNGNTVYGPALVISKHNTKASLAVNIMGGEFDGLYAVYEKNHMAGTPQPPVTDTTINIQDGIFKTRNGGTEAVYSQNITGFISGGTYSNAVVQEYCAEGFSPVDNGDDTFGVTDGTVTTVISKAAVDALAPEEGTGTLRFITKVDALGGTAESFGTWILPVAVFETYQKDWTSLDAPFARVEYTDEAIAAGNTFAADLTGIPHERFNDEIMAQSYIIVNGKTETCTFGATTVTAAAAAN